MAEGSADRTEQPTARRLQKARSEGRVAHSIELPASAVMLASMTMITLSGAWMASGLMAMCRQGFALDQSLLHSPQQLPMAAAEALSRAFGLVLPMLLVTAVVAVISSGMTGGFLFSLKALRPDFSKVHPLNGLERMFGTRALIELGKTLAKFVLVGGVLVAVLQAQTPSLAQLGRMPLEPAIETTARIVTQSALWVTMSLLLIALIDVPLQRMQFFRGMRMSKQEIKDELKESEGRPEVRAQIRRRQREMANARMMQRIKDADVVITNPEHFAVALTYDPTSDTPPLLVAKGVDHLAASIREEAGRHGVTIFEAPPLARALFFTTELEHPVPEELYFAVAQVIAYVYSLADVTPGVAPAIKPQPKVPAQMAFDSKGRPLAAEGMRA